MANISIDQLRALPDFAQLTKWDISFVTLPAVGALGFPVSDDLNLRAESVEIPKATMQKIEVQLRGHKTFHPGIMDYGGAMTITFAETVDSAIANFVKAWREVMWASRQGSQFTKAESEATIILTLNDNADNARFQYEVIGAMYEDSDFGTVDGSSSDIIRPSLTLSYDFFIDRPLGV